MEGVTVLSSFMFDYWHVGIFTALAYLSLLITCIIYLYCTNCMYKIAALIITTIISFLCLFAAMNLNIPWQHVTIDETVVAEEFFDNYKVLDVKDEIYFVRPLDN